MKRSNDRKPGRNKLSLNKETIRELNPREFARTGGARAAEDGAVNDRAEISIELPGTGSEVLCC